MTRGITSTPLNSQKGSRLNQRVRSVKRVMNVAMTPTLMSPMGLPMARLKKIPRPQLLVDLKMCPGILHNQVERLPLPADLKVGLTRERRPPTLLPMAGLRVAGPTDTHNQAAPLQARTRPKVEMMAISCLNRRWLVTLGGAMVETSKKTSGSHGQRGPRSMQPRLRRFLIANQVR